MLAVFSVSNFVGDSAVVLCRILLTVELFLDCYYYCAMASAVNKIFDIIIIL